MYSGISLFGFSGHINNQYNTCFWMLVKSGKSKSEAQAYLKVLNSMRTTLEKVPEFFMFLILKNDLFGKIYFTGMLVYQINFQIQIIIVDSFSLFGSM